MQFIHNIKIEYTNIYIVVYVLINPITALQETSNYLYQPFSTIFDQIKLYFYSVQIYGKSPFIYPLYGLAGLPEGFSRLSAIHGGTFMLNQPIKSIEYNNDGTVQGVYINNYNNLLKCKQLIADPSYFVDTDKVKPNGKIIRAYAILSHPLPNTNNADSCQIIIPYSQLRNRKNDIYIFLVNYEHKVVANGKWLAVISTQQETDSPRTEISVALNLLGSIDQLFIDSVVFYDAMNNSSKDQCYITNSYDSTSHFETATNEVIDMYKKLTGQELDLNVSANPEDLEADQ